MKVKQLVVLGIVCLFLFTFFSWYIKKGGFRQLDFDTTVRIQGKVPVIERLGGDELWEDASFFVSPPVSVGLVLVITLVSMWQQPTGKRRLVCLAIAVLFTFMIAAELYGKSVVHHPAPPFFMLKNPTTLFPKYHVQEDFSYPSGHMARVTFFAVTLLALVWQHYRKSMQLLSAPQKKIGEKQTENKLPWPSVVALLAAVGIVGYVVVIAIGKIYLGHHWLSDMLGGGLLGVGFGSLALVPIMLTKVGQSESKNKNPPNR